MTTVHKNLTGADLHEPKGADTAASGTVYVANGAGSGTWVAASSIITNTAFTTGDAKLTLKTVADSGWIIMDDGTIGDGSSGASTRANSDCQALFTLLWTNVSDTYAPVVGGRGASAAADWAAHKKITLTRQCGRALLVAGTGSGLGSWSLGTYTGNLTQTLITANLPPYTPSGSVSTTVVTNGLAVQFTGTNNVAVGGAATGGQLVSITATSTFTGTAQGGTSTAFSIVQPVAIWNVMLKL